MKTFKIIELSNGRYKLVVYLNRKPVHQPVYANDVEHLIQLLKLYQTVAGKGAA